MHLIHSICGLINFFSSFNSLINCRQSKFIHFVPSIHLSFIQFDNIWMAIHKIGNIFIPKFFFQNLSFNNFEKNKNYVKN